MIYLYNTQLQNFAFVPNLTVDILKIFKKKGAKILYFCRVFCFQKNIQIFSGFYGLLHFTFKLYFQFVSRMPFTPHSRYPSHCDKMSSMSLHHRESKNPLKTVKNPVLSVCVENVFYGSFSLPL